MLYNFTHFREQSSRKCVKFACFSCFSSHFREISCVFHIFGRVFRENFLCAEKKRKKKEKSGRKNALPTFGIALCSKSAPICCCCAKTRFFSTQFKERTTVKNKISRRFYQNRKILARFFENLIFYNKKASF